MSIKGVGWHQADLSEDNLTPQEREVLKHVFMGQRNAEIADALHVAEASIKGYIYRILEKLGLDHERQLIPMVIVAKAEMRGKSE